MIRNVCLAILLLTPPLARAADEAQAVFDSLYGRKMQRVSETSNTADDVELAAEMLKASETASDQPAFLTLLCDAAYTLGSKDPAGYETAIAAMKRLAEQAPQRRDEALERIAALQQRRYATAKADDKPLAADTLITTLTQVGEAKEAADDLPAAIKIYQRAHVVAAASDSPQRVAIRAALDRVTREQTLRDSQKQLTAAMLADSIGTDSAKALVKLLVVDRDAPEKATDAAAHTRDAATIRCVKSAAADPATLKDDELLDLADWYRGWAEQAAVSSRRPMLARAQRYYRAYLARNTTADLPRKKAELALADVEAALAKPEPQAVAAAPPAAPPGSATPRSTVPSLPMGSSETRAARIEITGNGYQLVPFEMGGLAYGNRKYVWKTVPEILRGWRYTRIDGGSRKVNINVTARSAGRIFVLSADPASLAPLGWKEFRGLKIEYTDPHHSVQRVLYLDVAEGAQLSIPQAGWQGTMLLMPIEK